MKNFGNTPYKERFFFLNNANHSGILQYVHFLYKTALEASFIKINLRARLFLCKFVSLIFKLLQKKIKIRVKKDL